MQIYRKLDIGTAKIKPTEMEGIPHYLIDIKDPDQAFSTAEFQELVREKITDITNRGKLPIIVGGTGLYIQSVMYDYRFSEIRTDEEYRHKLEEQASNQGNLFLHEQLMKIDPVSGEKIHPNNIRRVIRAIEIFHCTGKTMSELQEVQQPDLIYDVALVGLTMDREKLYDRINKRVDIMLEEGLMEEVEYLFKSGLKDCQSIQAIGYKELYEYFNGNVTLEEAIEKLKQNSRRYAKRQLTWFRNKMDVNWVDMTEVESTVTLTKKIDEISSFIEGKLKIKSNTY